MNMKKLFYFFSTVSVISIIIGMVRFDNFRDRLYLVAMLVMFLAVVTGLAEAVKRK